MTSLPMDRLREHVARILAAAAVPAAARDDLEEELLGHLVERWHSLVAAGIEDAEAAERAIVDFGSSDVIGPPLRLAYHSRLWASTIGVLLPVAVGPAGRPSAVVWLRLVLAIMVVLGILGLVLLIPTLSLFRLSLAGPIVMLGVVGLVLAFIGLGRAQRWALRYAVWATVVLLVEGIVSTVAAAPETIHIPLGSILAGVVLLVAHGQSDALRRFVTGSARLSTAMSLVLVAALFGPSIVPRVVAALPDPTQATADDLDLAVRMSCTREDVMPDSGPIFRGTQVITLEIDTTWRRTDLLPDGLAGIFASPEEGDTSGIRLVGTEHPWVWNPTDAPTTFDLFTGEQVGWWGSTAQSVELLPADVVGSLTVALGRDDLHAGHTLRTAWRLYWGDETRQVAWPQVELFYAHLDRFLQYARVECNGISHGVQVDPESVRPSEEGLPPLP